MMPTFQSSEGLSHVLQLTQQQVVGLDWAPKPPLRSISGASLVLGGLRLMLSISEPPCHQGPETVWPGRGRAVVTLSPAVPQTLLGPGICWPRK